MPQTGLKELLEAGVHFGHQTRRWHPKMRRYIFGERDGIYIIDLLQTVDLLERARRFAQDLATRGGVILFVGTKKQAKDVVRDVAEATGMPYVNERWLGGLLTNFNTLRKRIDRLHDLRRLSEEGQLDLLPTKERMSMQAELAKLETNLSGVRDLQRLPDAVFVTDLKVEEIAVREAARLNIPTIGLVDTNCDPGSVDYVIPGNDDAIRSCNVVIRTIGDAVLEGRGVFLREEQARQEAEEKARREEEERQRREAEERARREAEEQEKREAAQRAQAEKEAQAARPQQGEGSAVDAARQGSAAPQAPAATTPPAAEPPPVAEPPGAAPPPAAEPPPATEQDAPKSEEVNQ